MQVFSYSCDFNYYYYSEKVTRTVSQEIVQEIIITNSGMQLTEGNLRHISSMIMKVNKPNNTSDTMYS